MIRLATLFSGVGTPEQSLKHLQIEHETVFACEIDKYARTDTSYWHDYIFNKATDIRFLRGRIKFEDINGNASNSAPFPSAIIVYR